MIDRTKISALLSGVIYFTSVFYPLTSLAAANGGNDADGSKGVNGNRAGQVRPVVLDSPQTPYNGQDKTKPVIIGASGQDGQIGGQAAPSGNSNDNLSGNSDGNLSTTPNSKSNANPSGNLGNVPNANPSDNKLTDKDKQVQAQKPGNSTAAGENRNLKRNRRDLTSTSLNNDNYLPGGDGRMLLFAAEQPGESRANFSGNGNFQNYGSGIAWDKNYTVFAGSSPEQLENAKQAFNIERVIDYKNRTITWKVTVYNNGRNKGSEISFWLPSKQGHVQSVEYSDDGLSFKPIAAKWSSNNIESYRTSSDFYNKGAYGDPNNIVKLKKTHKFTHIVEKWVYGPLEKSAGANNPVIESLKWQFDKGEIGQYYSLARAGIARNSKYVFKFVTKHESYENLAQLPFGVDWSDRGAAIEANWQHRYMFVGPFGGASRHRLQTPPMTYVEDTEHLKVDEKKEVLNKIYNTTLAYYKNKGSDPRKAGYPYGDPFLVAQEEYERATKELEEAKNNSRILIKDNGACEVTWKDGTKSYLNNVEDYIAKLVPGMEKDYEMKVDPPYQEVNEHEPIKDIKVSLGGKEIELNTPEGYIFDKPKLPAGLKFDASDPFDSLSDWVITGTITEKIDWDKEGKDYKDYTIKVRGYPDYNNDNHIYVSATVYIRVKRDISQIPVGVQTTANGSGYKFLLLLAGAGLLTSSIQRKQREREAE